MVLLAALTLRPERLEMGSALRRLTYNSIDGPKKIDAKSAPGPQRGSAAAAATKGGTWASSTTSPELSLTELDNVAVPLSYFASGFCPALTANPLNIYMIENIDATAAQQNTVLVLMGLPWCFKIFFGLLADACPIDGQKRKPYMILGYVIHLLSVGWLAVQPRPGIGALAGSLSRTGIRHFVTPS